MKSLGMAFEVKQVEGPLPLASPGSLCAVPASQVKLEASSKVKEELELPAHLLTGQPQASCMVPGPTSLLSVEW